MKLKKLKLDFLVSILLTALMLTSCSNNNKSDDTVLHQPAMTGISSNGRYVITTDLDKQAILWDIKTHHHTIISKNANIYSAYFIPNCRSFLWQSLDNTPWKYAAIKAKPTQKMLNQVKYHHLILLSLSKHRNDIYFSNYPGEIESHVIAKNTISHMALGRPQVIEAYFEYKPRLDYIKNPESKLWIRYLAATFGLKTSAFVHVQNVNGQVEKQFQNFPVYGQVMSRNQNIYYAVNVGWSLYSGYFPKQKPLILDEDMMYGVGKLLNVNLSENDKTMVTSGVVLDYQNAHSLDKDRNQLMVNNPAVGDGARSYIDGVVVWNVKTQLPIFRFKDLAMKSIADVSPDGRYVVAGDENMNIESYDRKAHKLVKYKYAGCDEGVAIRFLSNHYFVFFSYSDYPKKIDNIVPLYKVGVKKPIAVLYLKDKPLPLVYLQSQDTIRVAPKAHELVLSIADPKGGILIYHYNLKKPSLTLSSVER